MAALVLFTDKAEPAVKGTCLIKPGALRHPAACTACGRHQDDLPVGIEPAVSLQDNPEHGRLACARRTGDHGHVIKKCTPYCGFE